MFICHFEIIFGMRIRRQCTYHEKLLTKCYVVDPSADLNISKNLTYFSKHLSYVLMNTDLKKRLWTGINFKELCNKIHTSDSLLDNE